MYRLLGSIWRSSSKGLRLNIIFKALVSVVTSFVDVIALLVFAQILSSLVRGDITPLEKIAKLLMVYRSDMQIETVFLISIVLVISLVMSKSVLILALNRSILKTLSTKYQKQTSEVAANFFKMNVTNVKAQPSYEIFLAVNSGLRDIFIIGTSASIVIFTEVFVVSVIFFNSHF
jgi:hypothetical protein